MEAEGVEGEGMEGEGMEGEGVEEEGMEEEGMEAEGVEGESVASVDGVEADGVGGEEFVRAMNPALTLDSRCVGFCSLIFASKASTEALNFLSSFSENNPLIILPVVTI